MAPDDFFPFGPMFARRPALAMGDSVVKYETADPEGGWEIAPPTSPKTLAMQRMRIFRYGFGRVSVQ
jgi:hypothetical protein